VSFLSVSWTVTQKWTGEERRIIDYGGERDKIRVHSRLPIQAGLRIGLWSSNKVMPRLSGRGGHLVAGKEYEMCILLRLLPCIAKGATARLAAEVNQRLGSERIHSGVAQPASKWHQSGGG
jgi:hypothetical protein